jgi:hypothetical protein
MKQIFGGEGSNTKNGLLSRFDASELSEVHLREKMLG